jgi:hypothetical protein
MIIIKVKRLSLSLFQLDYAGAYGIVGGGIYHVEQRRSGGFIRYRQIVSFFNMRQY